MHLNSCWGRWMVSSFLLHSMLPRFFFFMFTLMTSALTPFPHIPKDCKHALIWKMDHYTVGFLLAADLWFHFLSALMLFFSPLSLPVISLHCQLSIEHIKCLHQKKKKKEKKEKELVMWKKRSHDFYFSHMIWSKCHTLRKDKNKVAYLGHKLGLYH